MIRHALPEDWPFIRELCCRTGKAGDPIDPVRWPLFSETWVGPYQRLVPEWGYVALLGGRKLGYLTGCADTKAFQIKKLLWSDLPMAFRIGVIGAYRDSPEDMRRTFVRRALRLEADPNSSFGKEFLRELYAEYPAHLHVNIEAMARGTGLGRELIEAYRADLRRAGVRGIHLFCGEKPVKFYEKTGFRVVKRIEFRPGAWIHAMAGSH